VLIMSAALADRFLSSWRRNDGNDDDRATFRQ
jgi:hypothetical protein